MQLLIFDLDGTLIDSKLDLVHAVNAARAHMGMAALTNDLIASYVGEGAPVLIRRALGPEASQASVDQALQFFLSYYRAHQLDYTRLYPGVAGTLERLKDYGAPMAVLTNKPVRMSNEILTGLGVRDFFGQVYGGNSFDFKKPHPIGIETIMSETGATAAMTLMVGDSAVDVKTARNAKVSACGAMYGFQPETFEHAPPDFTIAEFSELADRIIRT
jgi:phosphoglycolate phosphatase